MAKHEREKDRKKKKENIFECEKDALSLNTTLTTNTHIQCLEIVRPSISSHLLLLFLSNIPLYIPFLILHYVSISFQFYSFLWWCGRSKMLSSNRMTGSPGPSLCSTCWVTKVYCSGSLKSIRPSLKTGSIIVVFLLCNLKVVSPQIYARS